MGLFDFKKKKDVSSSSFSSDFNSQSNSSSQNPFSGSSSNSGTTNQNDFSSGFSSQGMYPGPDSGSNNNSDSHYNPSDPFASSPGSSFSPLDREGHQSQPQNFHSNSSKNMEIVLSKLDAIRLAIQNIDHRLSVIENRLESQKQGSPNMRTPDEDNLY